MLKEILAWVSRDAKESALEEWINAMPLHQGNIPFHDGLTQFRHSLLEFITRRGLYVPSSFHVDYPFYIAFAPRKPVRIKNLRSVALAVLPVNLLYQEIPKQGEEFGNSYIKRVKTLIGLEGFDSYEDVNISRMKYQNVCRAFCLLEQTVQGTLMRLKRRKD